MTTQDASGGIKGLPWSKYHLFVLKRRKRRLPRTDGVVDDYPLYLRLHRAVRYLNGRAERAHNR